MWTEEKLNELLTTPTDKLVSDIAKIKGDIMILGAGGKMGPTLAILAKKADVVLYGMPDHKLIRRFQKRADPSVKGRKRGRFSEFLFRQR